MLRGLTKQLARTAAVRAAAPESSICRQQRLQPSTSLLRTFATSSRALNSENDKSASTQQLESQASGQPTTDPTVAGSSNVSDALQRELASAPDANVDADAATSSTASGGRQAASTNLDDILGSVSAVSALPGSEAAADESASSFRDRASPLIRGASASRYSPTLFSSSSAQPHRLFVNSSRNNTILTLTSPSGDPLASASGGSVGFKKSARSGYEAGYRAAFAMFGKINEFKDAWRIQHLEVLWNGFGQGREAVFRALLAGEGQGTKNLISKMTDKTPVKIGGVRPKKRRML
ncbi:likely mitochondrial ribosome protein [Pseudozyma hubeiensis SY62]|uniref:Likely mitochondrial ribosome protein n=1 Tax=Pseudozyma hubeiensis (strain SY62) TaxID=1305764 RepID=R9NZU4_PSEHS|nr:likely mitochondrial ribosome protein [Pseudozyma hubeiensis SY62]GAC94331.1 likely mitochondrial ribosome protein [Pseudozyma hubeiensis SY62]